MIDFLKNILKKTNFKSDNEDINKFNKIIYAFIIICTIAFICFVIYFAIKLAPDLIYTIKEAWNDSKTILNKF